MLDDGARRRALAFGQLLGQGHDVFRRAGKAGDELARLLAGKTRLLPHVHVAREHQVYARRSKGRTQLAPHRLQAAIARH